MKGIISTITLLFAVSVVYAQITAVDFETPADYDYQAWNGVAEVVSNTITDGINSSANAGKYTTPANQSWSNAAVVTTTESYAFKDMQNISLMLIAPSSTKLYAKLENGSGGVAQGEVVPSAGSNWSEVTINFTAFDGVDVETATFNKFTFFFNVDDNVGGEEWFFDNVVINEKTADPEAPTNLQVSNITNDSFTLTWDADANATGGTNIFIVEPAISSGDVYITTLAAGVNTYTYTGSYGAVTIQEGGVYVAKLQALPDDDFNAYAQADVDMTVTAIGKEFNNHKIVMYPNPASNLLKFNFEMANVEIYDFAGKLVMKRSNVNKINVSELDGIYLVKGKSTKGISICNKLIIN